jgi:uncharacterized RDD family membrane protein YckC
VSGVAAASGSGTPYAGVVTRSAAFALDVAILDAAIFVGGVVVGLIVEAFGEFNVDLDALGIVFAALGWGFAFTAYLTAFWSLTGQTPGMRALGIELRTTSGRRPPPRRSLLRVGAMIVAALPLFAGYVPILFTERRQGLHDMIARTVIRYVEEERRVVRLTAAPTRTPPGAQR